MPKIYKECIQCESDFYVTEKDQSFFKDKGLELPKRCWHCRKKNKEEAAEAKALAQAAKEKKEDD
jgi:ribosomal protein L33